MFLAFKEMARAKVRFSLLIAAIALLVFLILFVSSVVLLVWPRREAPSPGEGVSV